MIRAKDVPRGDIEAAASVDLMANADSARPGTTKSQTKMTVQTPRAFSAWQAGTSRPMLNRMGTVTEKLLASFAMLGRTKTPTAPTVAKVVPWAGSTILPEQNARWIVRRASRGSMQTKRQARPVWDVLQAEGGVRL